MFRWDGTRWISPLIDADGHDLTAIAGSGPSDVWVSVEPGSFLRFDGARWSEIPGVPGRFNDDLWVTSPTDVWATGDSVMRWDGTAWTPQTPPTSSRDYAGVWADGPANAWLSTEVFAARWDGASWHRVDIGFGFSGHTSIWGASSTDVHAVGAGAYHWNGAGWTMTSLASRLQSVHGRAGDDVWAIGGDLMRWDGATWSAVPGGRNIPSLRDVWTSPAGVWSAGDDGVVLRYVP